MITERLKIWILLLVVAGCGTGTAWAQKMVKVSGTVYNIAENRKVPFSDVTVDVYAAKTVAVGEDMKKILDSNDQEKNIAAGPGREKRPPTRTGIMKYWFRTTVR